MVQANEDRKYSELILAIDDANKICVDCQSEPVTHVSINNGATLCQTCASNHMSLGNSISYIRKINDDWDEYLFNYMLFGSNTRLLNSLKFFCIDNTIDFNLKYRTIACDYYRKTLRAKVLALKPVDDIDQAMGNQICTIQEESSEFDEYQVKNQMKITPFTKVQGFFGKMSRTIEGMNILDKIKTGSQKTWDEMKKAGNFVAEKTSPATEKIKQGANYVSSQVKTAYTDVKDKIIKKADS